MKDFIVFLAGAAVGAAAAALLTPTSGPELRARIRVILQKRGIIAADNIDEMVEMIASKVENGLDSPGKFLGLVVIGIVFHQGTEEFQLDFCGIRKHTDGIVNRLHQRIVQPAHRLVHLQSGVAPYAQKTCHRQSDGKSL